VILATREARPMRCPAVAAGARRPGINVMSETAG